MPKRKICFVITSQIHYSRSKVLLEAIRAHKDLELQIAVGASAILPMYGDVLSAMEKDGFKADAKIVMTLAGGSAVAMAKTTGIGVTEFATAFDSLQPDIVVVRGDRYEVLAAAIAASYMNITVAHLEGGDITGTIDESVRHAITKLAHIHFTTNEESAKRVLQLGEDPSYVFNAGAPELEHLESHNTTLTSEEVNALGVGDTISLDTDFLTIMFHPVTTEKTNREHASNLLNAIRNLDIPSIWFWPNVDAGTDEVAKAIRVFRENEDANNMHFIKYLPVEKFIALLKKTSCLVGNSSAGIKECSYLGIPVVNIGTRQNGRTRAENVLDCDYESKNIQKAIQTQLAHGMYKKNSLYYKKGCSEKIAAQLATTNLYVQKRFLPSENA